MKKLLTGLSLLALLVVAVAWGRGSARRVFATPQACVDAYYQALVDGDAAACRGCLGAEVRDDAALAAELAPRRRGLRGWSVHGEVSPLLVDEQYDSGRRRRQVHLERERQSWRIVHVAPSAEMPALVPYGTHVSAVSEK